LPLVARRRRSEPGPAPRRPPAGPRRHDRRRRVGPRHRHPFRVRSADRHDAATGTTRQLHVHPSPPHQGRVERHRLGARSAADVGHLPGPSHTSFHAVRSGGLGLDLELTYQGHNNPTCGFADSPAQRPFWGDSPLPWIPAFGRGLAGMTRGRIPHNPTSRKMLPSNPLVLAYASFRTSRRP
jgi:hypothetical protein